jgi:hypothetical protein
MQMMKDNMQIQSQKIRQQSLDEMAISHLVNTKEILLMEEMEKIRLDQTK